MGKNNPSIFDVSNLKLLILFRLKNEVEFVNYTFVETDNLVVWYYEALFLRSNAISVWVLFPVVDEKFGDVENTLKVK